MTNCGFKIDFIGVGAPKSGTSWIAQCLKEHPQICFSQSKEINFFNKKYVFYRKNEPWKYQYGINWYKKHFNHCKEGKTKGEFSVQYLADPDTPRLISENFPNTKIIIILRNPTNRLYSHYLFAKSQYSLPQSLTFEKVVQEQKDYVEQGFYHQHIQRYLKHFARESILIMIYEEIKKDPLDFIKKIYKFLGVNENFTPPSLYLKVNPTPISLYLWKLRKKIKKNKLGKSFISFLKIFELNKIIKKISLIISGKKTYKKMSPVLRQKLNTFYQSEIKKLETFLNRDLSFWQ